MNKINKKNPLTLDRMLYLICYNWGICSEVEKIITKLVFWGNWRPSLLNCPRLNFANNCDTKLKWMRHYQPANPLFNQHNYDGYTPIYIPLFNVHNYDASLPPRTTPHLDKISIYKENLTRSDIIEIKKYYLARVFTAQFSAFTAVKKFFGCDACGMRWWNCHCWCSKCDDLMRDCQYKCAFYAQCKKPYRKLSIKTFNGVVGRYCATNYW